MHTVRYQRTAGQDGTRSDLLLRAKIYLFQLIKKSTYFVSSVESDLVSLPLPFFSSFHSGLVVLKNGDTEYEMRSEYRFSKLRFNHVTVHR